MKGRIFIELLFLTTTEFLIGTYLNFDMLLGVSPATVLTINEMLYIHWVAFSDNYGRCFDGCFEIIYCVFNLNYI